MAPIVTEAVVKASRETIWNACFESMNWEKWDSDIEEVRRSSRCRVIVAAGSLLQPCILHFTVDGAHWRTQEGN